LLSKGKGNFPPGAGRHSESSFKKEQSSFIKLTKDKLEEKGNPDAKRIVLGPREKISSSDGLRVRSPFETEREKRDRIEKGAMTDPGWAETSLPEGGE